MDRNDYYALLGITPNASTTAVRRAFQKLARRFHPDLNPGDNVARVRYERIYEAFRVLTDPSQRERYDSHGQRPTAVEDAEPPRYGFEGFDFSREQNRSSQIFPELFRQPGRRARTERERGEDIHHKVGISFEESLHGFPTSFRLARSITCATCDGFQEIPSSVPRPCPVCAGRGRATHAHGFMLFARPCAECGGTGILSKETCPDCQGAGRAIREERIDIEIPKGVNDGDRVVIPGKGHEGRGTGRNGDLYVHVQVAAHPVFARKGDNLYSTVRITFTEAALGARVDVPTPEGSVKLRIPAGVQSGQKLRLSERGAPSRLGSKRGDLFVTVQVVTPTVYDDRSRELLRELDRLNPMDPREEIRREAEEASR
ncbi:MAG TPA: J domain-containing protein [Vicinamibacteria bacterium]|nr:J domain-containing protein [Vicinamibacteria bacterium]